MNEIISYRKKVHLVNSMLKAIGVVLGSACFVCLICWYVFIAIWVGTILIIILVSIALLHKYINWLDSIIDTKSNPVVIATAIRMKFDSFYHIYQINANKWSIDELRCYYDIHDNQKYYNYYTFITNRIYVYFNIIDYFRFTYFIRSIKKHDKQKEIEAELKQDIQITLQFIEAMKADIDSYQHEDTLRN